MDDRLPPPDPTPVPDPLPDPTPLPDPMKGIRGIFAMTLALEFVVVALALLVLPKFGEGATPLGVMLIGALAVLMLVTAGLQRRPWGLGLALALQLAMVVVGFVLVPALGILGVVFALVWAGLLLMRRDVAGRMARGELPAQRLRAAEQADDRQA